MEDQQQDMLTQVAEALIHEDEFFDAITWDAEEEIEPIFYDANSINSDAKAQRMNLLKT